MANPRQRAKARSHKSTKPSDHAKKRMHHKARKAPPLKGPEVLQSGWDKHKTVFQNYAALGLLPSIPLPNAASSSRSHKASLPFLPPHMRSPNEEVSTPKVGYGRIIRDEEGNVVDIIIDEEPAGAIDQETDEDVVRGAVEAKTDVVRELEAIAATAAPVNRHSSTSERTWLKSLVDKYGDDTDRMARDKRLNVWQKTEGEIRRMIRKAGGVEQVRR